MTDKEKLGKLEEDKFEKYLKLAKTQGCIQNYERTTQTVLDYQDKIDFYIYLDNIKYSVDVKAGKINDPNIISINFTAKDGSTGTLGCSKADFIAVHGFYEGIGRYYFIRKDILWNHIIRQNFPLKTNGKSAWYEVPLSDLTTRWAFWINCFGFLWETSYFNCRRFIK